MGRALDCGVPTHRHTGGAAQAHVLWCPMGTRDVPKEHPVITSPQSGGLDGCEQPSGLPESSVTL